MRRAQIHLTLNRSSLNGQCNYKLTLIGIVHLVHEAQIGNQAYYQQVSDPAFKVLKACTPRDPLAYLLLQSYSTARGTFY